MNEDKPDGQYDSNVGKHKTVETIETTMADDGVEETHISHEIKKASRWTFSSWNRKKYEQIDWSK